MPDERAVELSWATRLRQVTPNALSLARLGLGPLFPLVPEGARVWLFLASAATEFLDGFLARRWRVESRFGQILDPIADKVFVGIVILTLLYEGILTPLMALLLASRDLLVAIASTAALLRLGPGTWDHFQPAWAGKITTTLQLLVLLVVLIQHRPPPYWAVGSAGAVGLIAGVDYILRFLRRKGES